MPYNKGYKRYRKSGYYNKYGKRKKNIFWRRGKNKAYHMAKKALSMINVEYKFHDVVSSSATRNTQPTIIELSNIAQGDTDQTRDGAQIKVTSLLLRLMSLRHTSSFTSMVRVMLVLDKQTNQAVYVNSDLIADITSQDGIVSPLNLDNKYRFRVLFDKVIAIPSGHGCNYTNVYLKDLDVKLRYDASTSAIADLTSNSLSLVLFSNEPTNSPTTSHYVRLRYVDN